MIDVITPQGEFTGVTKPKSRVHADGDWHACVHGIVTDGDGRVLCQFRGPQVNLLRNVWDAMSVAGHISAYVGDPGKRDLIQQSIDALIREFDEEISVQLARSIFFTELCRLIGITRTNQPTEDGWMDRTLSVNWLLEIPNLHPSRFALEEGKVLDVQWMHVDEIEAALEGRSDRKFAVREPDNDWLMRSVIAQVRLAASGY